MIYVVLGAPGVGKGTRAKILCEKLSIPHISTGSLIRGSVEIFEKYKKILGEGKLLSDEAIKEMLVGRLKKEDTQKGFVLDGYPRTLNQVNDLCKILEEQNKSVDKVFLFEAPEQEIYNRIINRRICISCDKTYGWGKEAKAPTTCEKCGKPLITRDEDNLEVVKKRLEIYRSQIDPIIAYYSNAGVLEIVDALDKPEKVLDHL